jgi:hypothetical protein
MGVEITVRCVNGECPEVGVDKTGIVEDPGQGVICGHCGQPCEGEGVARAEPIKPAPGADLPVEAWKSWGEPGPPLSQEELDAIERRPAVEVNE